MTENKCVVAKKVEGVFSDILPQAWCPKEGIPEGFIGIVACYENFQGKYCIGLYDGEYTVYLHPIDIETAKDVYRLFKNKKVSFKNGAFLEK